MSRLITILVLLGVLALVAVPGFAAIRIHARPMDPNQPVIGEVMPRTTAWVMRPSPASSVIVIGNQQPIIIGVPLFDGFRTHLFASAPFGYPPVYIEPNYPLGPPTFIP